MHKKVQVARRSTVLTWLALAAELEARAILHTSGKMNLEVVGTCEASRTRACWAGIVYHQTTAAASPARFGGRGYAPFAALPSPVAGRAVPRDRARLRASAMARWARALAFKTERDGSALGSVNRRECGLGMDVAAALRSCAALAKEATKIPAKEATKIKSRLFRRLVLGLLRRLVLGLLLGCTRRCRWRSGVGESLACPV